MGIMAVFIGFLSIGIGFLIKAYPNSISGYNTMSKQKKKNVDIEGLSTYYRNGFIIIGIITIAGYYVFKLTGLRFMSELMVLMPLLAGGAFLGIRGQKFDHNPKKKTRYIMQVILVGVVVITLWMLVYGYMPAKVEITDGVVRISGQYGVEIKADEIKNVELADNLPNVKIRTNGLSFAGSNKGYFRLDEYGKSRLFIHAKNSSLFIIITDNAGLRTIFNVENDEMAEGYYTQIKEMLDD